MDFSIQDVIDGKVQFTMDDWFKTFESTIKKIIKAKFQDSSEVEKAQFICLTYMACSAYAYHNDPRELSEKTFPHLQVAILELQKEFKPFGLLLEAIQKSQFKSDMKSGLSNVEAVENGKKRLKNAFNRSTLPKLFKAADMEVLWD